MDRDRAAVADSVALAADPHGAGDVRSVSHQSAAALALPLGVDRQAVILAGDGDAFRRVQRRPVAEDEAQSPETVMRSETSTL